MKSVRPGGELVVGGEGERRVLGDPRFLAGPGTGARWGAEWGAGFWKDRQNMRKVQDRSVGMEFAIDPVNIQETAGLLLGRGGVQSHVTEHLLPRGSPSLLSASLLSP